MNKKQEWLLGICLFLSIGAVIISVIALSNMNGRWLGLDYLGVIVGIMGAMITALIGWQIFQVINLKNTESNISLAIQSSANDIYKSIANIYGDIAISVASENRFDYLLNSIMKISFLSKAKEFKECERLISGMRLIKSIDNTVTSKGEMLRFAFSTIENKEKIMNISDLKSLIEEFIKEQDQLLFPNGRPSKERVRN